MKNYEVIKLIFTGLSSFRKSLSTKKTKKLPKGFSLLEIMVVLVLVGLLFGVGGYFVTQQLSRGRVQAARNTSYSLAQTVELYNTQYGRYPTNEEGLQVLVDKGLIDRLPKDPWKRDYMYRSPGVKNSNFDVFSGGPNGGEDENDNIGNWPEE